MVQVVAVDFRSGRISLRAMRQFARGNVVGL